MPIFSPIFTAREKRPSIDNVENEIESEREASERVVEEEGGTGRWSGGFDRERIRSANKLDSGTQRSLHLDSFHETEESETFEREWERGGGGEIRLRIHISLVLSPRKSFVSALLRSLDRTIKEGGEKKERKKERMKKEQ